MRSQQVVLEIPFGGGGSFFCVETSSNLQNFGGVYSSSSAFSGVVSVFAAVFGVFDFVEFCILNVGFIQILSDCVVWAP